MREILEKKYIVDSRDSDMFGYLRTSSLLGFMQDIATEHSVDLHVSRETLVEGYGAFWMMVRMWLKLYRPAIAFEPLTIRTWHRGAKGASVHRDFDILVDGEIVGEAVTDWIIASIQDRKIIKPSLVMEFASSAKPDKTKNINPGKVLLPKNMAPCGIYNVNYSDTDINGHMNNTRYADIACDAAGIAQKDRAYVSEMQIGYLSESFPGEDIVLLKGEDNGYIYISGGGKNGKGKFDVKLKLAEATSNGNVDTITP